MAPDFATVKTDGKSITFLTRGRWSCCSLPRVGGVAPRDAHYSDGGWRISRIRIYADFGIDRDEPLESDCF